MLPPGLPSDTEAEVEAAAEALLARGVPAVLVKRGSAGSALFEAGAPPVWSPAAPVASVVDTTGAGDCFTAAYCVAWLRGLGGAARLRFAAAAAGLCVQREGALPSLPTLAEVEASFR